MPKPTPEQREKRRDLVRVRYEAGLTQQTIADELGVTITTVFNDVKALEQRGEVTKRPRGEAIADGVSRYWQTPAGKEERERRSERLRSAPPVERVCETCGDSFLLPAAQAAHQPGRFCSAQCHSASKRGGPGLDRLREGRRRWRERAAASKRERLDIDDVLARLPRQLSRTRAAVLGHIYSELLPATWDAEFHRWLVAEADFDGYVEALRDHPNWKLTRFARKRFRDRWTLGRHAGVLLRAGYTPAEAAKELGYTADYVTKLWRGKVTQDVEQARTRRRLLSQVDDEWVDFRDVYRALHVPAREAAALIDELVEAGQVQRRQEGRRVSIRRVSPISD